MKEHELKMSLKKGIIQIDIIGRNKNIPNDVILKQEVTNIIMMNNQVKDIQ